MDKKALQFVKRYSLATTYEEKLLCLYNAFFVLYKSKANEFCAHICKVNIASFKCALDTCREDHEGKRFVLSDQQLDSLYSFLTSLN